MRYPRILNYHEISPQFQLGITSVSSARFRKHLDFLIEEGFSFIPLRDLVAESPQQAVSLTFDDGYASFYDQVLPTLTEKRIPATIFIITGYIGRWNEWEVALGWNRRRHLSFARLKDISSAGITLGSHTHTHRDLTRLSDAAVLEELRASKQILEDNLGIEVSSLALPFGCANLQIFSCARDLGYREICAGAPGLRGPFPGVLPRMSVYRGDGAGALRRKLRMNTWERMRLRLLQSCSRGTRWLKG